MDDSKRKYLSGKILLAQNPDGTAHEEFFIKSKIGEGGSAICYEATRKRKNGITETGKLKEFYPLETPGNYYSLERLTNGQLVPKAGTIREFENMCEDYVNAYIMLNKVMEENPDNEILKGYIQYGEVLYGCIDPKVDPECRRPTVYIWSSGVPGTGFDRYISDIKKQPGKDVEEKLFNILSVMESLTDCMKALHTAGLLHLDIKPSNFLVQYDSDYVIKTEKISLFDINTLTSVKSKYFTACGTDGFCAPEILKRKADNRTDIYSLGAMLFNAIVIEKNVENTLYKDYLYASINQIVKHSALFTLSEINSDVTLISRICKILSNCLAENPKQRYGSCSELKADLAKAKERLNRLMNAPVDKSVIGVADSTIAIQKLLYGHPIYENLKQAKNINVLVLGLDNYGQKFIDVCLQAGQMKDFSLNIAAVSENIKDDKKGYMDFRPALSEFINVDGSLAGREKDAYATLEFMGIQDICSDIAGNCIFTQRGSQKNKKIIENIILHSMLEEKEYDYVFVSLENDQLNRSVARMISEELGHRCPVCYVSVKTVKEYKPDTKNKIYPLCVGMPLDFSSVENGFGEMAFNTHLSWKDSLNIDLASERKKFFEGEDEEDKYNRRSSLAFALSIKYKLHSVGIDFDDPLEGAKEFSKIILECRSLNKETMEKYNCMVDLEHRRWLIDMAIDGWQAPRGKDGNLLLENCYARGSVKDIENRTHPCMVCGSEASPLKEYTKADWDDMSKSLAGLDELDRMSVELHRCFKKHADEQKERNLLQQADLLFIQSLITADKTAAVRAFKEYQFALKNIINGVEKYSKEYGYYEKLLKSALTELPEDIQAKIEGRLAVIKHAFFPLVESNLYRNYKAYDEVLVDKIPFILSYRHPVSIAIPFEDGAQQNGRNEAVFSNVAAVSVLCPETIRYLYVLDTTCDLKLLNSKLDAVLNYLGKREIHTGVELIVARVGEISDKILNELSDLLENLGKKYPKGKATAWYNNDGNKFYNVDDYAETISILAEHLKKNPVDLFDGSNSLFGSPFDDITFANKLMEQNVPYFEFDWRNKTFTKHIGCDFLKFVKDSSFIRIRDMFALMNATDVKYNFPEFADDYENLWKIYTHGCGNFQNSVGNWNKLCDVLEKYDNDHDYLVDFTTHADSVTDHVPSFNTIETVVYFYPEYTYSTLKMLIEKLIKHKVLEAGSDIKAYASDTCRVELRVKQYHKENLKILFANPSFFMPYYELNVDSYFKDRHTHVKVYYTNLSVKDANIDPEGNNKGRFYYPILKELEKANYIRGLVADNYGNPKEVSFEYSSPRIKKLLTCAGEILEIYAYYSALETGYFDDVACGYEFAWADGGVKNEIDLCLTKGFRSIIVECKAVLKLTLDYFHKLHSIADHFGIGTTKVLLGNTFSDGEAFREVNKMQRSRGIQLRIKNIYGEDKIKNIGKELVEIMKNS